MQISKLFLAATFAAAAFAVALPVSYDTASGSLVVKSALAKKGADDPANHDARDDKGGKGGKGRGTDDGANHR